MPKTLLALTPSAQARLRSLVTGDRTLSGIASAAIMAYDPDTAPPPLTGKDLAELRQKIGMGPVEMARQAGVSYNTIRRIESGAVETSPATIARILAVLANPLPPRKKVKKVTP